MSVKSFDFKSGILQATYINITEYGKNHIWKFSIISDDGYTENFYGDFTQHRREFTGFAEGKPKNLTNLRRYKKYLKDIYEFTAFYCHEPTKTVDTLWNICTIFVGKYEIKCPEIWKIKMVEYLSEEVLDELRQYIINQPF